MTTWAKIALVLAVVVGLLLVGGSLIFAVGIHSIANAPSTGIMVDNPPPSISNPVLVSPSP